MKTAKPAASWITVAGFAGGLRDLNFGIAGPESGDVKCVRHALRNIPGGTAISSPVYCATGSLGKTFWFSFASRLDEPIAASVGYLLLAPFVSPVLFGITARGSNRQHGLYRLD